MAENDYDAFAVGYDADNTNNVWNAFYERPAILSLIGDVDGRRVLDAGCGGGVHAEALVEKGALLTGVDSSEAMLEIARGRLRGRGRLVRADLNETLPVKDCSFDIVLGSLVMHYLRDWTRPLAEFNRVLVPGGRFVFSTHHPFMDHELAGGENYFETYRFEEMWLRGGKEILMKFWHRPLHAMVEAVTGAGFRIEGISEPQPDERARELFPLEYELLRTKPRFLFFVVVKGD